MNQSGSFDFGEGERLKEIGMKKAAGGKKWLLDHSRDHAFRGAEAHPRNECDIDFVYGANMDDGIPEGALGKAAGSVFLKESWFKVGTKRTTRKSSHARHVNVWRLKRSKFSQEDPCEEPDNANILPGMRNKDTTSVTVTNGVLAQMRELRGQVNWSVVAEAAFVAELKRLERNAKARNKRGA